MKNYFKHILRTKGPGAIVAMIIFGIIAITGLAILFGYVFMWLWNALMPELFDLPELTYWQGVGLFILAKIIFGGFGSGSSSKSSSSDDWTCKEDKKKAKNDLKKWELYDKFWKEEGEAAYQQYQEKTTSNPSEKADAAPAIESKEEKDGDHYEK